MSIPIIQADSPWYMSGSVGGIYIQDHAADTTFSKQVPILVESPNCIPAMIGNMVVTACPISTKLETVTARGAQRFSYSAGPVENLAVGYRAFPRLRLEAELGYASFSISGLRPSVNNTYFLNLSGRTFQRQSGGAIDRLTWTVNAFYDFPTLASRFSPYIGLGYGGNENHRTTGHFISSDGTTFTSAGGSSGGTEALLEAGLGVRITRHWVVSPAYRYDHFFVSSQDAHVVQVAARYSF